MPSALITGTSTGIGYETSLALALNHPIMMSLSDEPISPHFLRRFSVFLFQNQLGSE